ncbi:MAG: alpha/beta-type small acid-soluble spore protein [Clostridia bacterium]|nr:alpha/beta-type small acid-soluble spore protein [Clostridia bacterium]MDD4375969.1 alpha/beta-type small acid-soluble spore protein [Clostridia bacterium]
MPGSNNNGSTSNNKAGLEKMKYEVASEVGVDLKQGYNGHLTSQDAGKIGGNMVKKLVERAASQL